MSSLTLDMWPQSYCPQLIWKNDLKISRLGRKVHISSMANYNCQVVQPSNYTCHWLNIMTLKMVLVCNKEIVFLLKRNGHGQSSCLWKDLLDSSAQSVMLGQSTWQMMTLIHAHIKFNIQRGYVILKLFGGINIGLVVVLQLSIWVHKYLYVDFNTLGSKRCPCSNWDVVKPISITITNLECVWIFGGITSRHSIGRGANLNDVGPMIWW